MAATATSRVPARLHPRTLAAVSATSDALRMSWVDDTHRGGGGGGSSPPPAAGECRASVLHASVLRANCLCSETCRHPGTNQRLVDVGAVAASRPALAGAACEPGGSGVRVTWADGHASFYPTTWLAARTGGTSGAEARLPTPWDAPGLAARGLPRADFPSLMGEDGALLEGLDELAGAGFLLISGAPAEPGVVERLAARLGGVRLTHYGATFDVRAKCEPESLAYTPVALPLHTDLPYR
jgi:gamma-butyrobetaine dioxygenase